MTIREAMYQKHPGLRPVAVFEDKPLHYFIMEYFNMMQNYNQPAEYTFVDGMHMDSTRITLREKQLDREYCYVHHGSERIFISTRQSLITQYIKWVIAKLAGHLDCMNWTPPEDIDKV